jgi:hypothetical protein
MEKIMLDINLPGTKVVEVPYFSNQIDDISKKILIIGECKGGTEGVSETIKALGCVNVTTTDILESPEDSWLRQNTDWPHVKVDFTKFNEELKYDYIIAISVFEHFGFFWEGKAFDLDNSIEDMVLWNHDLTAIKKSCKLLNDSDSKLIITLPAGPYMNYQENGYPFLRYYDGRRQDIIKREINNIGYHISDEKFFFSSDFINWEEVSNEINDPKFYPYYSTYTPNIIWGLTIQKL